MIMIVCGLLLAAGLAAVLFGGGERFQPPVSANDGGALLPDVARRVLWWANVLLVGGGVAGVCMAGAGGRLVMRLLAATSPEDDNRFTENGSVIGEISVGGTGFLLVQGVAIGMLTALLYGLLRRWLPAGRAGGAAFGLLLLLALSTVLDPLRPDNRDFQIVGPGWLSVAVFSALAIAHGLLLAVATAWLSRRVPLMRAVKDLRWYIPLALVLMLLGPASLIAVAGIIAAIGVLWAAATVKRRLHSGEADRPAASDQRVVMAAGQPGHAAETGVEAAPSPTASRTQPPDARRDRRVMLAGRIALLGLAVACLPGFIASMASILAAGG